MTSDQRGFTLLETLVALVVLGFVVLGLNQGLRFGLAAWNRQAGVIDRDLELDSTYRLVRNLIEGMTPANEQDIPALTGSRTRLSFISRLPVGAPGRTRIVDVSLRVDEANRLILTWRPHLHAKVLLQRDPETAELLTGVASLTLSYYGAAGKGRPVGWMERWDGLDAPQLVRMHVDFSDNARVWPDLIAAPMRSRDEE